MKKDIQIPEVSGVEIAVIFEYSDLYNSKDWNIYIINDKEVAIETVIIVSKGFDDENRTSVMRKTLDVLPANSFAKIGLIQPELFKLVNQYQVTFFMGNLLFEKTFLIPKYSISKEHIQFYPVLNKKGIIFK